MPVIGVRSTAWRNGSSSMALSASTTPAPSPASADTGRCVGDRFTDLDPDSLIARVQASPGLIGRDLVCTVTCDGLYQWSDGEWCWPTGFAQDVADPRDISRRGL